VLRETGQTRLVVRRGEVVWLVGAAKKILLKV